MPDAKSEHDPRKTALDARCRIFGVEPSRANREALTGQHSGSQIGLVIERCGLSNEIPALWRTWQGFCMAMRTYRLRYIGQSGTAKGASIAMVPDRMETDQSHSVDLRSIEERDRDAVSGYMRWHGYLMHLSAYDQRILHDLEQDRDEAIWRRGKPTGRGMDTLEALRRLRDVVEK